MGGVLTRWVIARMPLPSLVEVRRHLLSLSVSLSGSCFGNIGFQVLQRISILASTELTLNTNWDNFHVCTNSW
jgi:hypothetical protein